MEKQKVTNDIRVPNKDLDALRIHFPHCFDKNGKFDIAKFQNQLNTQNVELTTEKESYGLDWLGKSYARLLASDPATTLLKADETHNAKPENANAQNLLIKGNNLEVLKHLANAYYERVKMIYIDPPYNTGSDGFVYNDDRKFTVKELQNLIGIDEEKAKRILDFTQSKSNSHSAWLTFMYPRLYIAKQLLREDGVIFVSIDDNEVAQLRLLMDEVFGEENFVAELINIVKTEGRRYGSFAKTHEYILSYSKNNSNEMNQLNREEEFKYEDEIGKFRLTDLRNQNTRAFNISNRPNLYYPFYINEKSIDGNGFFNVSLKQDSIFNIEVYPLEIEGLKSVWRWGSEKSEENRLTNLVAKKGNDNIYRIYQKYRSETIMPKTVWHDKNFISIKGTKEVQELFNGKTLFDFPKPIGLIKNLLSIGSNSNDIILDFFAGSGTTGDAVMQLNSEDGGNRTYILVQLPESIDPTKNKAAYDFVLQLNEQKIEVRSVVKNLAEFNIVAEPHSEYKKQPTIFEITKERLLRAAKKINAELDEKTKNLELKIKNLDAQLQTEETKQEIEDLRNQITQHSTRKAQNTFKVFETIPIWEGYNFEAEQFDSLQTLFDAGKFTEEDIKALLTTWKTYDGISLTQDLESLVLSTESLVENETQNLKLSTQNYTAYYGNGKLYLVDKGFTTAHLKALLDRIDSDKKFSPTSIICFGYHFESKSLRELSENVKSYANKKNIDIDFITRY